MEAIASVAPEQQMNTNKGKQSSQFHRFQLLRYREVERLREVMETVVPIHGTGNFPTLEIKPSRLVQVCIYLLLALSTHVALHQITNGCCFVIEAMSCLK